MQSTSWTCLQGADENELHLFGLIVRPVKRIQEDAEKCPSLDLAAQKCVYLSYSL